jgi:hypothetical protein
MDTSIGISRGHLVGKFLAEIKSQRAGQSNRIDKIVAELGEQDGKDLIEALNDLSVRPAQIIKALQARKILLSASVITRYRVARDSA